MRRGSKQKPADLPFRSAQAVARRIIAARVWLRLPMDYHIPDHSNEARVPVLRLTRATVIP
jgi:hypothetical protein